MTYKNIDLQSFEKDLRIAMEERITQFVKATNEYLNKNPTESSAKSKRQWAEEFKIWSLQQKELEDLFLSYLKQTTGE